MLCVSGGELLDTGDSMFTPLNSSPLAFVVAWTRICSRRWDYRNGGWFNRPALRFRGSLAAWRRSFRVTA